MFVRKAIYIYIYSYIYRYIYIYEALQLNYPDNLVSGASYTLNPMPTASCLPAFPGFCTQGGAVDRRPIRNLVEKTAERRQLTLNAYLDPKSM